MPDRAVRTTQGFTNDECACNNTNEVFSENNLNGIKEAVGIHTDKVYDQCRDKDCLEDVRVYFTPCGQELINCAINVKVRKAEIIWVFTDIEPLAFNRGYYSVDLKFFFRLTFDVYSGLSCPTKVEGLATFDKRVVLYGSEGNCKVFSSNYTCNDFSSNDWEKTNLPKAIVEVVDPIALSCRLVEVEDCCNCCCENETIENTPIPETICQIFGDNFVIRGEQKKVYVSLGVFSIVKLERKVQLLIPTYDFLIPDKECIAATEENPCDLFSKIQFPMNQFFPPNRTRDNNNGCGCGCDQ